MRCVPWLIAGFATAAAGCSFPHPLQDDVTGLPLSKIIRKISCEAKDALDELLDDRGLGWQRHEFKSAIKAAAAYKKSVMAPIEVRKKELAKRHQDLNFALAALARRTEAFTAKVAANIGTPEENRKAGERLLKQRADLLEASVEYIRDLYAYNREKEAADKKVATNAKSLKAQTKGLALYYSHDMAYNFNFRITEKNGLTAEASWRLPVVYNSNPSSWSIGGGVEDTKERKSDRNVRLVASFEDLHGIDCSDAPENEGRVGSLMYPIRGKIGVKEVIGQYLALIDRAVSDQKRDGKEDEEGGIKPTKIFSKTDAYTDEIIFTTTVAGSLAPSITLNPTLRETFSASGGLSASRVDYHSVLISLKPTQADEAPKDALQTMKLVQDDIFLPR